MNDKIQVLERAFHVLELVAQDTNARLRWELAEKADSRCRLFPKLCGP